MVRLELRALLPERLIRKKVCLLGSYAVGKTSLVRRFVYSEFSDRYHTTVGVKVDKEGLVVNGHELHLVLWDLYGEDRWQEVRASYLRGAAGALVVVDATRLETLEVARGLRRAPAGRGRKRQSAPGPEQDRLGRRIRGAARRVARAARLGAGAPGERRARSGVEEAFAALGQDLLAGRP
ncbi:MAG: ADP-ribosylation factor-like protein [Planctomycetota bacterium]